MAVLEWIPRSEWGSSAATEEFIRERWSVTKSEKISVQVHHTAAMDTDDETPNRWDRSEAIAYMRRLQWSRPDLGPLPYSENLAISEDLSTVWILEGRGLLKVGAHTAGHNRSGIGWGIFGNFDHSDPPAAELAVRAIEARANRLRWVEGFHRLGLELNPRGWEAWGHRDSSTKSCPGNTLYPLLATFEFTEGEGWTMTTTEFVERLTPSAIEAICHTAKAPGGEWVINPGSSDRAGAATYYRSILSDPDNADWINFRLSLEAAALSWSAMGGRGSGSGGGALSGTFTGVIR